MMKCPKCGADNPDGAEFCNLCMERLIPTGAPATRHDRLGAPGDVYTAPGEWRGDAEALRPEVSKVVVSKVRRFRLKLAVYGTIVALIIIWLVLSLTLWGNPSPGKRASQFIDAVNDREEEVFTGLFQEKDRTAAESLYDRIMAYLASRGTYEGLELKLFQQSEYDAVSYIDAGTIQNGGGSPREITSSDNLMIVMENHKGAWYVVPEGTKLVP